MKKSAAKQAAATFCAVVSLWSASARLAGQDRTVVRPQDTGAALVNPAMGWVFHHYDNGIEKYGLDLEPSDTASPGALFGLSASLEGFSRRPTEGAWSGGPTGCSPTRCPRIPSSSRVLTTSSSPSAREPERLESLSLSRPATATGATGSA